MSYPSPVIFKDDEPKKGYVSIVLTVDGVNLRTSFNPLAKKVAENADISVKLTSNKINLRTEVKNESGEMIKEYLYEKCLPEDIDVNNSRHELKKMGKHVKIVLILKKKISESWEAHEEFFISQN